MIEKMKPDDLDAVMQIWLQANLDAHPFVPAGYWRQNFAAVRAQLPEAEILLWREGEAVCGFAGVTGNYLAGLFVAAESRGNGIGSALLRACQAAHERLSLGVYAENRRAVAFYSRHGFVVAQEGMDTETGCTEYTMVWHRSA